MAASITARVWLYVMGCGVGCERPLMDLDFNKTTWF
jgi:hypothetical protein